MRRLATGLLLAFAALLVLPLQAQAQTLTTLVSNTGETLASGFTESIVAQRVRTGMNTDGYTISEVDIRLKLVSGSTSVTIRKNASGEPGDLVAVLTNPRNLSPNSRNTFTAPVGTRLNASRSYWITVSEGISNRVQLAFTTSDSQTGAQGWSIDNDRLYRSSDSESWTNSDSALVIAIKGTAGITASTDATLSDLTLADDAGNAISLTPTFASDTTSYMASVANGIDAVTLTATTNDSNAMVAITSDDDTTSPGEAVLPLTVGSNTLTLTVTAEDGSTTETYTVAVTRGVPVPVDIEPNYDRIGAGIEDLVFTLTREGATTDELEATVTIVQDESWLGNSDLSHTVTFTVGDDTATLTLAADRFSFDPDTSGNLTATVTGAGIAGGMVPVQIVSTAEPPITVSYDMSSYTFAEDAADVNIYVVATLDPAYPRAPSRTFEVSFSSRSDTAISPGDYGPISWSPEFLHADYGSASGGGFVARKRLQHRDGTYFSVEDDDVYEGNERLVVNIDISPGFPYGLVQFAYPDGTTCEPRCSTTPEYEVIITDEEDRPDLSLGANPPSLAEEDDDTTTNVAENASVLTVAAASPKTFATEQTITLTFAGSAVYGTHYSVSPADTDANATGHQVVLPAETASVEVTVTAAANDTADGDRSIAVTGSREGTAFGSSALITILDNETTTSTPVTIEAEYDRIGAGLEDLVFTLTREGATTDELEATVTIVQDRSWLINSDLSHTVTFAVDSATATLTLGASRFSFDPDTSGNLTATVTGAGIAGGMVPVQIVSTAEPPITISYDKSSYTFAEDAANVEIYVVATLDPAYPRAPSGSFFIAVSTKSDTATLLLDYVGVNVQAQFVHGDFARDGNRFEARKRLQHSDGTYFGVENDDVYEGPEGLVVSIEQTSFLPSGLVQFARPNGETCGSLSCSPNVEYPVTITDEEDRPVLSLSADPASIAEEDDDTTTTVAENASVLTVAAASPKTFATEQTITLTFGGSADYGTHYSVNPVDADANAMGHQVVLPAETASVQVTVTAAANDTADGDRSIDVTGSRDGTAFGNATIALPDDDTTTTTPGVTVSTTALTVTEQDSTGDGYTVVLDTEPTADVVVTVAGHAGTDVTPDPTTLTFSTSNWDTAQTVTVTAGNDTDTTDDSVTLTHSAASTDTAYSGITIAGVVVTVRDNDTAQVTGVTVTPGNARLVMNWTAVDNATGYTVQWKSGNQGYNTGNRQATVTSGTTTSHTITGLTNGTEYSVQVSATRTDANDGPPSAEVQGTPAVPTAAGVTVSKTALTVTEEDATGDSYTVALDSRPTAAVTVTVAGHAGTAVTPDPTTLTFTASNWDTAQTVTVTAGDDADTANHLISLTHSATSTDGGYSSIAIAGVTVTVNDNDTAQVTGVTVAADKAQLVVSWTAVDNATGYNVQWKSGGQGYNTGDRQATVTSGSTTRYTIPSLTNGTEYTVRVIATRTGANDGPPSAEVTGTPVANTPTDPGPLTLTVEAEKETVTEGEPVRYRIVMSKPTGGVEVESVYRYRGEFLRHDPSSKITGIRSRRGVLYWEVERQTLDDAVDEADGRFTVRLRPGDGYQLGTPSVARVTIRDNDPEAVSPPVVSVADATVEEGTGPLAFRVTLDRAPVETATVDWETLNGSAKAGQDYVAASGTLVFAPGETVKTVTVAVLDDVHDEGREVMLLYLPNAVGAIIADALAKGTISNSDPMPRALMARFGRTAAVHVVEHVEERLAAPREVGVEAQVAGRQLRPGMEREMALDFLSQLGSSAGMHAPGAGSGAARSGSPMGAAAGSIGLAAGMGGPAGGGMGVAADPMNGRASPDGGLFDRGLRSMGLGVEHLLTSSSFALTRETRQGGILSFWSRGARSSFAGREEALSLGGDVRTTMVGADYAKGPLVAGLSLSHSRGLGEYVGVTGGQVASSVTGLYPWLGYQVTDRVSVWGVTGYGAGGLLLTPNGGPALRSGLSMAMAAAGTRGELVAAGAGGFALAFKADALWVGTSIDGVDGAAGRLAATDAAVSRFRTGLEGSRAYTLAGRLSLRPSVEVGLRHDGGDAENGAGMDVGGGLMVSDTSTGLAVDLRVRMLVMHQAEEFRERGMALSLSYNPTPSTPLGFVARVAPSWGGEATSGAEALWGRETMAGMASGGVASGNRLDGEVGYGLPVGSRFVGTPTFGVGTSESGRDYRLGYRLGALGGAGTTFELGVDAQRRERSLPGGTDHGALARATMRW